MFGIIRISYYLVISIVLVVRLGLQKELEEHLLLMRVKMELI